MKDLYTEISARIIEQLEAGIIPWRKPWSGTSAGAISHATGRPYSLINQLLLVRPGEYLTFNQIQQEGGRIKKGSKASIVVFWKKYIRERKDENGAPVLNDDGSPKLEALPVLRYFQVFHIDDTEGITPKFSDANPAPAPDPIDAAEKALLDYVSREKIQLEQILSDEAYYSPARDAIHLPIIEQFDAAAEYYSTAFHEATHSTGHPSRLNRFDLGNVAAFGSETYSKEELVAEIGAASVLHILGIETPQSFKNSAAYIQSWLRALKNDKRLIISAAARAEKAVNMILDIQPEAAPEA